jgi:hypothetical protein
MVKPALFPDCQLQNKQSLGSMKPVPMESFHLETEMVSKLLLWGKQKNDGR